MAPLVVLTTKNSQYSYSLFKAGKVRDYLIGILRSRLFNNIIKRCKQNKINLREPINNLNSLNLLRNFSNWVAAMKVTN